MVAWRRSRADLSRSPWPDGEASFEEDRGSFSHAVCRVCGWAGPGRRSRRLAREDSVAHTENGCDTPKDERHADHGPVTPWREPADQRS